MCIAIPMVITAITGADTAEVTRSSTNTRQIANFAFCPESLKVGDTVLVFNKTILRTVSEEEAQRIELALACVDNAMITQTATGVDDAFGDIIENSGKLPPHLQAMVGKKVNI